MSDNLSLEEAKIKLADYSQNYLQYLEDIRRRVFIIVIIFILFFGTGFFLTAPILKIIVKFFQVNSVTLVTNSPFQFIDLAMNVGIIVALIACLPVVIFQTYGFLKDGLTKREKKWFLVFLPISFSLFLVGFSYSFGILYFCLNAIAQLNLTVGVQNLWDIDKFLSQIVLTSVLLGFIFEFPLILTLLIRFKMINLSFLKNNRRYAFALMLIAVSFLPPTDGLSMVIMVLPLVLIYEATIFLNTFSKK